MGTSYVTYYSDLQVVAGADMSLNGVNVPVGSLLLCASAPTRHTMVHGRMVVRDGQLATVDLGPLLERHNRLAVQLSESARQR